MNSKETEENFSKAKKIVFRLLRFRLRSEGELRQRLAEKNFPINIIEQAIQYFKNIELVNDHQFARQWTSSRLKKPFGLNRIRMELKKKGIDDIIIQEALEAVLQTYNEFDIVATLAQHRATKYKNLDSVKIKQRVYGYLQRRGFHTNTIIKAIENI